MMVIMRESSHLDDAQLMQLIDADDQDSVAALARHVDECARCAAGADRLRADAALVGDWLSRAAFEDGGPSVAPRVRSVRGAWLRAAAVLLLVAAPVAALPQLREWLKDAVTGGAGSHAVTPPADAGALQAAVPVSIRFAPEAASLAVTFDATPADGTLHVSYATGMEAVLEVAGTPGGGPVLSADGVRIRNDAAGTANYSLQVPQSVSAVTVRIGGGAAVVLDRAAMRAGAVLQLSDRQPAG